MALIRAFLGSISALYELQKSAANAVCVSALLSSSFQFITGDTVFANSRHRSTYISERVGKENTGFFIKNIILLIL